MEEKERIIEQMKTYETNEKTVGKMWSGRDIAKFTNINNTLKRTDYYDIMDAFIKDENENTVEMRLSEEVRAALTDYSFSDIQRAVQNPFAADEFGVPAVWRYEKCATDSVFSFQKRKPLASLVPFLNQGSWAVWLSFFIAAIVMTCIFQTLLLGGLVLLSAVGIVVPAFVSRQLTKAGYFETLYTIDQSALNGLPLLEFVKNV